MSVSPFDLPVDRSKSRSVKLDIVTIMFGPGAAGAIPRESVDARAQYFDSHVARHA